MKILVIGGTGFIGSFVVKMLVKQGHQVTVFHRGLRETKFPPSLDHILGDRRMLKESAFQIRRASPELVLDMILSNRHRAQMLMEVIKGIAGRVVVASSIDVYRVYGRIRGFEPGPPVPVPIPEEGPVRQKLHPHSPEELKLLQNVMPWVEDDYEKIEVEQVVLGDPDLPGTVLRLPAVYGPGDPLHRLFPDLKRMDDGRSAILVAEGMDRWRWSRGYVENVADAIALAVNNDRAAGKIYNVADPDAMSHIEWLNAIAEAARWTGKIAISPWDQMPEHLRSVPVPCQDWTVDTSRIRAELGYHEHVPLDIAMTKTVAWERANPPHFNLSNFNYAAEDQALSALGK